MRHRLSLRRTGRGWTAAALAAAGLALAGCQSAGDGYPSPYGPSTPTPLPRVAGGGLWNPTPLRATGFGSATLFARLPEPEPVPLPPRSSETPELMTPEQVAARQRQLEAVRDSHVAAMDRRLRTQGRVRGPDPGSPPVIEGR